MRDDARRPPPNAWNFAWARGHRALTAPLLIALPALFWVIAGTSRALLTPLGRDQGIFQYVAWAILRGAKDYRDVRDVNGPLTHLVHVVFLLLGGLDEHRFHALDLLVTGLSFAAVGACIPAACLGDVRARPRPWERWGASAAWALAGWVVLSVQYLQFGYWDLAQRESFFDWFLLPSLALQLVAQAPGLHDRVRPRLLIATFALSTVPWFGKPTYALFTAAQVLTLVIDRGVTLTVRTRLLTCVIGGALGALVPLAFLLGWGDAGAYARIAFHDVPAMYRFMWARSADDIFAGAWYSAQGIYAIAGSLLYVALIASGAMPRRALAVGLVPLCGIVGVIAQAKGFPYHFHPVTAGIALQGLVLAAWLWERARTWSRAGWITRTVPVLAAAALGVHMAEDAATSPHVRAVSLAWKAATPEQRSTPEYFANFPETDFFPWDMRQAATYVREHTAPTDRVQTYGMDPYLLVFADRLSATPYIYAYDLNCDAALNGWTGGVPTEAERGTIRAICDAHARDLADRLRRAPPAAFVFFDKAPLLSQEDAWRDFRAHQAEAARWVAENYREAATFGMDHVWLRNDLAGPAAPPDDHPADDDVAP